MDVIDVSGIKLVCHIPYVAIVELECNEAVNEHAEIQIKVQVSKESIAWLEKNSLCNRMIKIEMAHQGQFSMNLCGNIYRTQWEVVNSQYYVIMHARSMTGNMDNEKKTCMYQRIGLSYQSFLKSIVKDYNGSLLIEEKNNNFIDAPLLQYKETDWEFIRYLAGQLEVNIFVNASADVPKLSLGVRSGKAHPADSIVSHKESVFEKGFHIQTGENYVLGALVKVDDKFLPVLKKNTQLRHGCIEYRYFIGDLKTCVERSDLRLKGMAIRGKIIEVTGKHLKLDFGRMEDKEEIEHNFKYPFHPITDNIMYAMPEVGAEVELYFPTSDIKQAYVRNCFLSSLEWPDESIKIMETCYEKSLTMGPGEISWIAQSNMNRQELRLQDSRGLRVSASENIVLDAEGDITMRAGMSCMLTANNAITMEQNDTIHAIKLSGDCIQMRSDRYEVSSTETGGKVRKQQSEAVSECDSTEMQQHAIAAIPYKETDLLTRQILASIPMTSSNNISKKSRAGYSG